MSAEIEAGDARARHHQIARHHLEARPGERAEKDEVTAASKAAEHLRRKLAADRIHRVGYAAAIGDARDGVSQIFLIEPDDMAGAEFGELLDIFSIPYNIDCLKAILTREGDDALCERRARGALQ